MNVNMAMIKKFITDQNPAKKIINLLQFHKDFHKEQKLIIINKKKKKKKKKSSFRVEHTDFSHYMHQLQIHF